MKKTTLLLIFTFLLIGNNFLIAQNKITQLTFQFDIDGHLLGIQGIKNDYPKLKKWKLKKEKSIQINVQIVDKDNLYKEKFRPLFNKFVHAYFNLKDKENSKILNDYYGINSTEREELRKVYCGYIRLLNETFKFTDLKLIGIDTIGIKPEKINFDGLYAFNLVAQTEEGELITISEPVKYVDSKENTCGIKSDKLKGKVLKSIKYDLRWEKPEALVVNKMLTEFKGKKPNIAEYKNVVRDLNTFKKNVENINLLLKVYKQKNDSIKLLDEQLKLIGRIDGLINSKKKKTDVNA